MPTTRFTRQNMPHSGEELKQALQNALKNASPLEDFITVTKLLAQMESRHKIGSEEFYTRFQRGEMGDNVEYIRWATKYEIYQQMKAEMEHVFNLLEQYALPVMAR